MADILDFRKKGSNDNGPKEPTSKEEKPEPHVFEITYTDGETELARGYLSIGPLFVAIVDGNDYVELVVATTLLRSVRKICTISEWDADIEDDLAEDLHREDEPELPFDDIDEVEE